MNWRLRRIEMAWGRLTLSRARVSADAHRIGTGDWLPGKYNY